PLDPALMKSSDVLRRWTVADSLDTYLIPKWGGGFFSVSDKGMLQCHPAGEGTPCIDVKALVDELSQRGLALPLLVRFSDILRARIEHLNQCFRKAIAEYGYKADYRGVYPIKVNQDRYVVGEIVRYGKPFKYGLEAGSKPELLAVMAMLDTEGALVICNGYKDEEYIETALLATKLGLTVILVVEKPSELAAIRQVSQKVGVKPAIGIRVKLSSRGSGRWEASGGDRSKFGLSAREMLDAVAQLKEWNMLDSFQLLHFHLGSQISSIRSIKNALREAGRFSFELSKQGPRPKHPD